jgi:hypothetical protein
LLLLGLATSAVAGPPTPETTRPALTEVTTGKYKAGQVWKFKGRPGEPDARLTVLKVESFPDLGVIVHVALSGLHVRDEDAPGGFADRLPHAPFSEAAIARSVTTLEEENATLPEFEKDYQAWRRAFYSGKGGVFNKTVVDLIEFLDK